MISSARLLVLAFSVVSGAVAPGRAQSVSFDWLSGPWGMSGGRPDRSNAVKASLGDAAFRPLWSIDIGRNSEAQPHQPALLDGERAYLNPAGENKLVAIGLTTGAVVWEVALEPLSALALVYHDGKLFGTGTHDGGHSIWRRDAETGALDWERPLPEFAPLARSMVVNDDGLWFVNARQNNIFHHDLEGFWLRTYRPTESSIRNFALGGRQLFHATEFGTHVFDRTSGGLISTFPFGEEMGEVGETLGHPVIASGMGLAARANGPLLGVNLENETVAWRRSGEFQGLLAADDRSVYALRDKFVYRYHLETGELEGRYETTGSPLIGQPLIFEDALVVSSDNARYVFDHELFRPRQTFPHGGLTSYSDGYLVSYDGRMLQALVLDAAPMLTDFPKIIDAYRGRAMDVNVSLTPSAEWADADVLLEAPSWMQAEGPDAEGLITLTGTPPSGPEAEETFDAVLIVHLDEGFSRRFPFVISVRSDPAPAIRGLPERHQVFESQPLRLEADVTGAPPLSLQWYRDGEAIADAREPTLLIPHISLTDGGRYVLVADNEDGEARSEDIDVTVKKLSRDGGPWSGDHRTSPITNAYPGVLTDGPFRRLWSIPGDSRDAVIGGGLLILVGSLAELITVTAYDVHSGRQHWQQRFEPVTFFSSDRPQLWLEDDDLFLMIPGDPFAPTSGRLTKMRVLDGEIQAEVTPGPLVPGTLLVEEEALYYLDRNDRFELSLQSVNRDNLQPRFGPLPLGVFDLIPGGPPLSAADGLLFVVMDGEFTAFDAATGERSWSVRIAPPHDVSVTLGSSGIVDGQAVVKHLDLVAGVDLQRRELLWKRSETLRGLADGQLFFETDQGLQAIDLHTRDVVQTFTRQSDPFTTRAWGTPLITVDRLIVPVRERTGESTTFVTQIYDRTTGLLESELPLGEPLAYSNGVLCGGRFDPALQRSFVDVYSNFPEPTAVRWPSADAAVGAPYDEVIEMLDSNGQPVTRVHVEGLPEWLTLLPSGPGEAVLRGLPPAGSAGEHRPILVAETAAGDRFTRTLELTVWASPEPLAYSRQSALQVRERGAVVLSASVEGLPPMDLQWFRNGEAIAGAQNARLAIETADFDDAGAYHLEAVNAFGRSETAEISVDVLPRRTAQGDWTQLSAVTQNTRHYFPITIEPVPASLPWRLLPQGSASDASMASTNGVLAVLTQRNQGAQLSAFALGTGVPLWSRQTGDGSQSAFVMGPVAGPGAFVTLVRDSSGPLRVWDAATGMLRWELPSSGGTQTFPVAGEHGVFLHQSSGRQHRVKLHSWLNGGILWEWENDADAGEELYMAFHGDKLVVLQEGVIHCLEAESGRLIWKTDWITNAYARRNIRFLTVTDDLLFVDRGLGMEAFDTQTGRLLWERHGSFSHCVVADTQIYCGQGRILEVWDRLTGEVLERRSLDFQDPRMFGVQNGLVYQLQSQSGVWLDRPDEDRLLLDEGWLSGLLDGYLVTESPAGWSIISLLPYTIEEADEGIAFTGLPYRLEPSVISATSGSAGTVPGYRLEIVSGPSWLQVDDSGGCRRIPPADCERVRRDVDAAGDIDGRCRRFGLLDDASWWPRSHAPRAWKDRRGRSAGTLERPFGRGPLRDGAVNRGRRGRPVPFGAARPATDCL